uniref:tetratricopeptide repeat protein n=1 Tax=Psychrobacter sp. TaxID=56811 RepID=UPI00159ABB9C|nr:tetratricopeptide repeat protein [Psychrobacter sp.]QJS05725.1 sel1 repeat protein [Psychrobacter sp.]
MQALKNIVINGAMILALLFGLTVSATAVSVLEFEKDKALAESGNSFYQGVLGEYYSKGNGVRQDYSKALEWFKKSANQNDASAQAVIGAMYDEGQGVRQNKTTAKEWYGKSCDNGYQSGCDYYKRLNEQGY